MRATFDEVLDAVEHLAPDEQSDLIAVIQRRLAEQGRQRVVAEVREGRCDFQAGRAMEVNIDELIGEIEL